MASLTCTGTYTVLQADIDNNGGGDGDIDNTATADSNQTDPVTDSAAVPLTSSPALSIVKDATTASYNAVGQTISYTIVATNTGNTTIASATVTDTEARPRHMHPGQRLVARARRVDELPGDPRGHPGRHRLPAPTTTPPASMTAPVAASICDDADVPAVQTKTLSITKTDNTTSYDHVGQVITFTIVATNTGNVPQAITVSDTPALDNFSCTPTNGTSVAPPGTMTCTGTHAVTQADLNAGNLHDLACADATGATQVCAPDDVPGVQNPLAQHHQGRRPDDLQRRGPDHHVHHRGDQHG